jgi:hypothetical protein
MALGSIFVEIPRITPDAVNPEIQASKLQKTSAAASNATARQTDKQKSNDSANNNRCKTPGNGLVPVTVPKKDGKTFGFFFPGQGCTPEKMFAPIRSADPSAKLPCFHHKAPNCTYIHGTFYKLPENHPTCIIDGMMEHKTARLNRKLMNNKRFKSCIDGKYNEPWNEFPASDSTNDGT